MKILKLIIGTIAVLFILAHVIELFGDLSHGSPSGHFAFSRHMGHIGGISLGIVISILCFRKGKTPKAE